MNDRLKVVYDDPFVHVSLQGKTSMMLSIEAVVRSVWTAKRHGAKGILFDIRESVSDDFHTRVVKLAAEAPTLGIDAYRIAVLGHPADPRLPFIEDVAADRGIRARTFSDRGAAVAWLQDADGDSRAA